MYHYTPEEKIQSKFWTSFEERAPEEAKIVSVYWDSKDVTFIDNLEKGKTITGKYYADLLTMF